MRLGRRAETIPKSGGPNPAASSDQVSGHSYGTWPGMGRPWAIHWSAWARSAAGAKLPAWTLGLLLGSV